MIRLQCDCGREITAPDGWLGMRVKCPQCGSPVIVRARDGDAEIPSNDAARRSEMIGESVVGGESEAAAHLATAIDSGPVEIGHPSAPANGDPFVEPAAGEEPAQGIASSAGSESSADSGQTGEPVAPPAPRKRLLAPKPPVNAVLHVPIPKDEEADDRDYDPRTHPRILGTAALLIGLAAGAAYWFPVARPWAVPAAGVAFALAAIGFTLAMSRHRLGYWVPLVALVVSCAALAIPSVMKGRFATDAAHSGSSGYEPEDTGDAARSRKVLKVALLRPVKSNGGKIADLEFKLINTTGRAVDAVDGSLWLYDRDHGLLDKLRLNVSTPLGPGKAFEGTSTWTLSSDRAASALEGNHFTAEYRADAVRYADGSQDTFAQ
jgi:DNA-directed RNA polymerase subunit RPC12/RpoP